MVTSIDVDHSGSRLLAGSRDYGLRMFDFNGMKSDMRSFRRIEPSDGHPIHSVSLSPTGQQFPAPHALACMPATFADVQAAARVLVCMVGCIHLSRASQQTLGCQCLHRHECGLMLSVVGLTRSATMAANLLQLSDSAFVIIVSCTGAVQTIMGTTLMSALHAALRFELSHLPAQEACK